MNKHYIECFYPDGLKQSSSIITRDLEGKALEEQLDQIAEPMKCYAYRFYDIKELEHEGEILTGQRKNFSPMYYFGFEIDIKKARELPNSSILINQMEVRGWKRVADTKCGTFPLEEGDVVSPEREYEILPLTQTEGDND